MKKLKITYFALGIIATLIALIALNITRSIFEVSPPNEIAVQHAAERITCPVGSNLQFDDWGKSGKMASCKLIHGTFVGVDHGVVMVRGEYDRGQPTGDWTYFNQNGTKDKTINYK